MQGITRNIVASVMLHSALLAAVFAIGGSSMQQTRRLMIVSLFDELQPEPSSPHPGPAAAPARKNRVAPAAIPAQDRPRLHASPAKNQEIPPAVPVRGETAPALQTPAVSPAKMSEHSGVSAGAKGGAQDTVADVRPGAGNPAMPVGKSGPETVGSGIGSAGREQQPGEMDPALRRKIRDTLQSNLVYPYLARKKRIEGTVLAEFRLNNAGMPENMRIVKTSNYAILDEAAKETIQKAAPYPAQNRRVEIPITFRLRERE